MNEKARNDGLFRYLAGGSSGLADGSTHPNLLEVSFAVGPSLFANWGDVAPSLVELFRFDYALYAGDRDVLAAVERLRATHPDFDRIWSQHRVRSAPNSMREINHPQAGLLALEPSIYAVIESPGLRFLIYTPGDGETRRKIADLIGARCGAVEAVDRP